ncbi:MAG TPA: DNA translocase FtsK 4TM domain-containing protein, partial [Patescibacteria group bacterium]|nr:DNA translocase FtsK 4TM domain-containing protein [Patescibacteria group bacterium]
MTRYSQIVRRRRKRTPSFLPESVHVFLARRVVDLTGSAFLLGGLGFLAALASYHHTDPSLNTAQAGTGPVGNWLGVPGAYIADLLLQTLGIGGAVPGVVFMIWGASILRRRPVRPLWTRLPAMLLATLLTTVAAASIPAGSWLLQPYMGGSGGTMMMEFAARVLHGHLIAASVAGVLALVAFLHATNVTGVELTAAALLAWEHGLLNAFNRVVAAGAAFIDWVQHYGHPDYKIRKPVISREEKKQGPRKPPPLTSTGDGDADDEDEEETETETPAIPAGIATGAVLVAPPKKKEPKQKRFALEHADGWQFPSIDLLHAPPPEAEEEELDETSLRRNADMLQNVLKDFNVEGDIVSIHPGPVVTLYELEPAPGTKSSRVISLSDDIARSMSAVSVRSAVVPGRNVIGIELPNRKRQTVFLRSLMESQDVQKAKAALPLVLGKDIGGHPVIADLTRMPHLLVAGTTGSGKSVAVNTMILSLLYSMSPEKCRFIMIDPKMLE